MVPAFTPMKYVVIDFETASEVDLKKTGARRYAQDPSTEIICLVFQPEGGEPIVFSDDTRDLLEDFARDPSVIFIAHNVSFEKAIWRTKMVDYGIPDVPNDRWHDTIAASGMRALPQRLEHVAKALQLPFEKDMKGHRFMLDVSKGRRARTPEAIQRVTDYCIQDVKVETAVHQRLGFLPPAERKVWLLDQEINERGVPIDLEFVAKAQLVVDRATGPAAQEFQDLTGVSHSQRDAVLTWVRSQGVAIENMRAETLDKLLGGEEDEGDVPSVILPPTVARALQIRRLIGSASIKKLRAMRECVEDDGRVRNLFGYHVAGTGRWAGRLIQPQNFPRGSLKIDGKPPEPGVVVDAIMTGDPDYVSMVLDADAIEAVVSSLRHAIIPSEGNLLSVGDFAGIEARIVLALSGQHDKAELLGSGADVYCDMAQSIYGRPITKNDVAERTIGKNTVLGCGFGMGAAKFFERYCPQQSLEFAQQAIDAYRKEWAPEVPKLWFGLERAAINAAWGKPDEAYGVRYQLEDQWLTARLPSGRKLWYYAPTAMMRNFPWETPDKPKHRGFTYWAYKLGRMVEINGYGGLLTENVVQALARDLLVRALFLCRQNGLSVIMHAHDEIVCDDPGDHATELQQIMEDRPGWAVAMKVPVKSETWCGDRYKK